LTFVLAARALCSLDSPVGQARFTIDNKIPIPRAAPANSSQSCTLPPPQTILKRKVVLATFKDTLILDV